MIWYAIISICCNIRQSVLIKDVHRLIKRAFLWIHGQDHMTCKYKEPRTIHPSTKSPLAGAARNYSQSQARQLCDVGLSVATSDKPREI